MTEAELQEIEARANAASPPPWTLDPERHTSADWVVSGVEVLRAADGEFVAEVGYPDLPVRRATVAFIAAARTDVPALLAEVRRLREDLEDARRVVAGETMEHCQRPAVGGVDAGQLCLLAERLALAAEGILQWRYRENEDDLRAAVAAWRRLELGLPACTCLVSRVFGAATTVHDCPRHGTGTAADGERAGG